MEPADAQSAATEPVEAVAPRATSDSPDLEESSLYFNRELSWLDFNDRVLQLAEDSSVPLLERVKFCAIWESNLDEFFMVRVANLHEQIEAGLDARGGDGMGASQQIDPVPQRGINQRNRLSPPLERGPPPAVAGAGGPVLSAPR